MAEGSAGRRPRDLATLFGAGTLVGLTDGEILRRAGAATGEEAGALFEAIVARHGPMVRRVCLGLLGDAAEADDAFQATFLVLARRLREARRLESVGGWLHGVAARVSARARVDAARRRRHERARGLPAVAAPGGSGPDPDADRAVREEVGRLPTRYREVVVLCYWEGLTHEQAAARLGCPLGTVRSRSARARDLLRRRLARRGLAPEAAETGSIVTPALPVALARAAAGGAAATLAGRPALGLVGVRAVELSRHVLRRMSMLKVVQAGAASALALVAIVGLGRAGTPPPPPPEEPQATAPAAEEAGQTPPRVFHPYVVQPPDLLLVEVLQALEGRPISGERLVRPDGKITLGFYGDVEVAGLTIPEVKEKVAIHLKRYLNDDVLGLVEPDPESGKPVPIAPKDTNRVFVDVTSYNSTYYYLVGAFKNPDRFCVTGSETILDAVILAGGLADDADARNVLLVREHPQPGQPKAETVDVDAIILGSDGVANHRLQPGDRLIARRIEGHGDERTDDAPSGPRPHGPAPRVQPLQPAPRRDAPNDPALRELQLQILRLNQRLDELSKKMDARP